MPMSQGCCYKDQIIEGMDIRVLYKVIDNLLVSFGWSFQR